MFTFKKEKEEFRASLSMTIIVGVVVLSAGFLGGILCMSRVYASATVGVAGDIAAPSGVDMTPVWKAWEIINDNFVPAAVATSTPVATTTEAKNKQLVYGMISGMADSLNDPYTFFLPPEQNKDFNSDMNGSFEGVGMQIETKDQIITVVSPLKGTPAEQAGIQAGDVIVKIDGKETKGMDVSKAVDLIRGPKGSAVVLTVMRDGWKAPKDISVTRDTINVPTVTEGGDAKKNPAYAKADASGIYVISLMQFTSQSPELFRNALRNFVQSGDTKLILDLRGNPGGFLDAAVQIASWFLPSGKVIVTEDYAGHAPNIVHRSFGYDIFNKDLKMVVLVDKGSASASEILANALQYHGVAKLVGTNTFGKGCVQELFNITPDTAIKVTVARWLGPDGTQIPSTGIIPDVMATSSVATAEDGSGVTAANASSTKPFQDTQMLKAIDVLNNE